LFTAAARRLECSLELRRGASAREKVDGIYFSELIKIDLLRAANNALNGGIFQRCALTSLLSRNAILERQI
jgi:hypothetical protein